MSINIRSLDSRKTKSKTGQGRAFYEYQGELLTLEQVAELAGISRTETFTMMSQNGKTPSYVIEKSKLKRKRKLMKILAKELKETDLVIEEE